MYYSVTICSCCLALNFVSTLIYNNPYIFNPYIVLSIMCSPCLIVITCNPLNSTSAVYNPLNSTSAVYNHQQDPQIRRRTYSSQDLKSLDNTKQLGSKNPKPRLVPYKAIAMIRKLRINQKPIRSRHNRLQWLRQKGINRNNLQNIFISEDIVPVMLLMLCSFLFNS